MKKYLLSMAAGALLASSLPMHAFAEGLDRQVPSQEEIVQYIKEKPLHMTDAPTFKEKPTETTAGQLDATGALNTLNLIRLLSGTPFVEENANFSDLAQSAAFIMKKGDQFSHSLNVPAGMSATDLLYRKGALGASSSNIGWGYSNTPSSIMYGYMYDEDKSNIERVGHRRWLLNPTLRSVGFGQVDDYTVTYVFDRKSKVAEIFPNVYHWSAAELAEEDGYWLVQDDEKIAWPAENMPIQYMKDDVPFSLSLGADYDIKHPVVTVKNTKTSQTEVIDIANVQKEQVMTTSDSGYGYLQALIWRTNPKKFHYKAGETYAIHIDGILKQGVETPIDYNVSFFDLENYILELTVPTSYKVVEGETFEVKVDVHYDYSDKSKTSKVYVDDSDYLQEKDATHYKALKAGKTELYLYVGNDDYTVPVMIESNPLWAKSIQTASSLTLKKGKTQTIKANVLPKTAPQQLAYTVKNPKIATVSKAGKIVAKKKGTTTMTIKGDRGVKKNVKIIVK